MLMGGGGDDTLVAGMGDDVLTGGDGADFFAFEAQGGMNTIADFTSGMDMIKFGSRDADGNYVPEMLSYADGKALVDSESMDADGNYVYTHAGTTIMTTAQVAMSDVYGDQTPPVIPEPPETDHDVTLDDGDNTWPGANVDNSGDDTVRAMGGEDTIYGGAGDDQIDAGTNDDKVDGGAGDDIVLGGAGNDTLVAGTGDDRLTGGAGDDFFAFEAQGGMNTIADFTSGMDMIKFGSRDADGNYVPEMLSYADGKALVDSESMDADGNYVYTHAGTTIMTTAQVAMSDVYGDQTPPVIPEPPETDHDVTLDDGDNTWPGANVDNSGDDTVRAMGGEDTIYGGAGDDQIDAGTNDDKVDGGAGDDIVLGGAGNDTLVAGTGDDRLTGGAGDDFFAFEADGGMNTIADFKSGMDTIKFGTRNEDGEYVPDLLSYEMAMAIVDSRTQDGDYYVYTHGETTIKTKAALSVSDIYADQTAPEPPAPTPIELSEGNDTWPGDGDDNSGDDTVSGMGGHDSIDGGAGNDQLMGGAGHDTLMGGADDDMLMGGAGHDELTGGAGDDTFAFGMNEGEDKVTDFTSGEDMIKFGDSKLSHTDATGVVEGMTRDGDYYVYEYGGTMVRTMVALTAGDIYADGPPPPPPSPTGLGDGHDFWPGVDDDNTGDDHIDGEAGNDTIEGGDGKDTLLGGEGDDDVDGGDSNDVLRGGEGADTLKGGRHADKLYGDAGADELMGEHGHDELYPSVVAQDTIEDNEDDRLATTDDTLIDGGDGSDLVSFAGLDRGVVVQLGTGDTSTAYRNLERFQGGEGDDSVSASQDTSASLRIYGNGGDDTLNGGDGHDHIDGGMGALTSEGGAGNDTIIGGDGNPEDSDLTTDGVQATYNNIDGGGGDDQITSGAGDDTIQGGAGDDTIRGGGGDDDIDDSGGSTRVYGEGGNDNISLEGGEVDNPDTMDEDETVANYVDGGAGNDTINSAGGNDTLMGGAGDDTINGGAGADMIDGGSGALNSMGGEGDDTITGGDGNPDADSDTAGNQPQYNNLVGDGGDDMITSGAGNDTLDGGDDDDTLVGGAGRDALTGGAGEDYLDGGAGIDELTGGADDDVFRWGHNDVITDFGDGDQVDIRSIVSEGSFDVGSLSYAVGGADGSNVVVSYAGGNAMTFEFDSSTAAEAFELLSTQDFFWG
jgi:Ca2+-binding RTX toxin-like protein